jgi:prolyl-tRNA editing enzyme YbaK/EbsC (Cys-tRNA(Pro) deacylase)
VSTTQQKAHKTPAAATALTPKSGLEITAGLCALSSVFPIAQRDDVAIDIGMLDSCPVLIDVAVAATPRVVVGSGVRRSKLALPGAALASLPGAEVLADPADGQPESPA